MCDHSHVSYILLPDDSKQYHVYCLSLDRACYTTQGILILCLMRGTLSTDVAVGVSIELRQFLLKTMMGMHIQLSKVLLKVKITLRMSS